MFLARITGHIVATQKDKTLGGQKLFVIEPLNVKYDEAGQAPTALGNTGRAIVAIDVVGAGEGQLVLVVQGSSARMTEQTKTSKVRLTFTCELLPKKCGGTCSTVEPREENYPPALGLLKKTALLRQATAFSPGSTQRAGF